MNSSNRFQTSHYSYIIRQREILKGRLYLTITFQSAQKLQTNISNCCGKRSKQKITELTTFGGKRKSRTKMDENVDYFPFDFASDFTAAENQIINEVLMEPFDGFGGDDLGLNSYILPDVDYMSLSNTSASNDAVEMLSNLFPTMDAALMPVPSLQSETITGDANMIMSYANLSQPIQSMKTELPTYEDAESIIMEDKYDKNFVEEETSYQNLETFDVPQLYDNLQSTFGLKHLKDIDEKLSYPALKVECDQDPVTNENELPLAPEVKWKTYLMPLNYGGADVESVHQIQQKLRQRPNITMSIVKRHVNKSNEKKILMVAPPKKTKKPLTEYIPVDVKLKENHFDHRILLPRIDKSAIRRKRKAPVVLDSPEVTKSHVLRLLGTGCFNMDNGRVIKCKIVPAKDKSNKTDENKRMVEVQFSDIHQMNVRRRSTRQSKQKPE